jgi:hypothetical protein
MVPHDQFSPYTKDEILEKARRVDAAIAQQREGAVVESEFVVLPQQSEIRLRRYKNGSVTLWQDTYPGYADEAVEILIAAENQDEFIDKLTDAFGITSVGRA